MKKIIFVVNVDWFFISHRLPLAEEAMKRSLEVILIAKNTGRFAELQEIGIKCIDLSIERGFNKPFREIINFIKLCFLYSKLKPDIIHQITLKQSIYGTLAASIFSPNSKLINAITGLGYAFIDDNRSVNKKLINLLMKVAFSRKRAGFIFQNGDDKLVFERLNLLTCSNYVIIKGAGVDENDYFRPNKRTDPDGKLRIILVARMLKDKGIFEFISAAESLKHLLLNKVEFIMVGGIDMDNPAGISEDELRKATDQKYIFWFGQRSDIKEIYASADIVCLPSYREGLPKSLVEAMAMECPIITTDTPGCRDCVEEGVNGFIVPVRDYITLAKRIKELVDDKHLRLQMGKKSRIKMKSEMSLDRVVKLTFQFYGL